MIEAPNTGRKRKLALTQTNSIVVNSFEAKVQNQLRQPLRQPSRPPAKSTATRPPLYFIVDFWVFFKRGVLCFKCFVFCFSVANTCVFQFSYRFLIFKIFSYPRIVSYHIPYRISYPGFIAYNVLIFIASIFYTFVGFYAHLISTRIFAYNQVIETQKNKKIIET